MASSEPSSEAATTAPKTEPSLDLNEEELDDLDGMDQASYLMQVLTRTIDLLDEFSAIDLNTVRPKQFDPQPPQIEETHDDLNMSETAAAEFSKQLEEKMAALMGSVDESPEMNREIQVLVQNLVGVTGVEKISGTQSAVAPADSSSSEQPFQQTIRRTMERIQASGEKAETAVVDEDPDDILSQMLKEMQNGGLDDATNEEGFSKMLMNMMEQLTNKEILYEPMKELHDKFPSWMREHGSSVGEDDLIRYREQKRLVGEIVGKFDEKGYSDSRPADREFIVERMQKASHSVPLMAPVRN